MKIKHILLNSIVLLAVASGPALAAELLTGTWDGRIDNSQNYGKTVIFSNLTTEKGYINLSHAQDAKTVFYPGASGTAFEATVYPGDKSQWGGLDGTVSFGDQNDQYTNYCVIHLTGTPHKSNHFIYTGTALYENHGDLRCSGPRYLGPNEIFTISISKR